MSEETFCQKCLTVAFAMVLAAFAFVMCCGGIGILFESGALTKHHAEKDDGR